MLFRFFVAFMYIVLIFSVPENLRKKLLVTVLLKILSKKCSRKFSI